MQEKLVSVIIPVYKVEKYLDQCVTSLVNQTYKNLEIILVDDGSPDLSGAMCDTWAEKDNRIRVIHKQNAGAAAARNTGLEIATGEYIGFVDSDDCIAPTMYEKMVAALQSSDCKMACCNFTRFSDMKEQHPQKQGYPYFLNTTQALISFFMMKDVGSAMWDKLFDEELKEDLRLPEGEINEEYPLFIPLITKSQGVAHTGEALYYYREVATGVTASYVSTTTKDILKHFQEMQDQILVYGIEKLQGYFDLFCAKTALSVAVSFAKNKEKISEENRMLYPKFKKILRKNFWRFIFSKYTSFKNKIFYILAVTNTIRPLYKILGRL